MVLSQMLHMDTNGVDSAKFGVNPILSQNKAGIASVNTDISTFYIKKKAAC